MKKLLTLSLYFILCSTCWADNFYKEGIPAGLKAHSASEQIPIFTDMVKVLSPAVVNVAVETDVEESEDTTNNPFFKREPNFPYRSLGSGFIISADGYIVTNFHVIDKGKRIVVRLLGDKDDRTEYEAKLIAKDTKTDLALLKIEPKGSLPMVYLGDSDAVEVGDWVVAIGNQFQLGQTVTAGIVSAKGRRVHGTVPSAYDTFIQTDASINPGSSGGPLFNTKGQVIGVNTAIFTPGKMQFGSSMGFNIGIGFAIPINLVKSIVSQLKDQGKVTRGILGVLIQVVDADVAEALNLNKSVGALVADVIDSSPASKAGFKRRDVIVKYQNTEIMEHEELPVLVASTKVGSQVAVDVLRDGKRITLNPIIDEMKDEEPVEVKKPAAQPNKIGLVLGELNDDIMRALKITDKKGVFVEGVEPGSLAQKSGFAKGDLIEEFGSQTLNDAQDFNKLLESAPKNKPVLITVKRIEGKRFLTLKLK